jgi:Spy/CpxP family protein refolding chaperone
MKHLYRFGFLLLVASATACAAQGPTGESGEADDATEESAATDAPAKHKGRGGDRLIRAALELDLSDAQRATIEGLKGEAGFERPAGMKDFMGALASGVRANAIDEKAMDAKIAAMGAAGAEMRAKHAAALEKLHATLTPAQRKELVEKMQAKMAEKEAKWAEKREAGEDGHKKWGRKGGHMGGHLAFIAKKLDLSDAQKEAAKKAIADAGLERPDHEEMKGKFEAMHAQKKALLAAFATDTFDADALLPEKDGKGKEHLARMVSATKAVLPVLDAGQREKLAQLLESEDFGRFGKHGKGKRGHHGAPAEAE